MLRNNKNTLINVKRILSNTGDQLQDAGDQLQKELFLQLLKQHSDIKYFTCYRPFYYLKSFDPKNSADLNCYIFNQTDDVCYYVDIEGKASCFDHDVIRESIKSLKKLLARNNIQPSPIGIMERLDDSREHTNIKESLTNLLSYFPGHKIIALGITYPVELQDQSFDVSLSHQVIQESTNAGMSQYPGYSIYEPHSIEEGKSQADAYHNVASFNLITGYFEDFFHVYQRDKTRRLKVRYGIESEQFKLLQEQFSLIQDCLSLTHLKLSMPLLSDPNQPDDSLVLQSMAELPGKDLRKLIDLDMQVKLEIAKLVVEVFDRLHRKGLVHCDVTPANILVYLIDGRMQGPFIVDPDDIREFFKIDKLRHVPYTPGYYLDSERCTPGVYFGARVEQYAVAISLLEFLTGLPVDTLTTVEGVLTDDGLAALQAIEDTEMRAILAEYTNRGPRAVVDINPSGEMTQERESSSEFRTAPPPVQSSPKKRTNSEMETINNARTGNQSQPIESSPTKRTRTSDESGIIRASDQSQSMQISPTKKTRISDDTSSTSTSDQSQSMQISPTKKTRISDDTSNTCASDQSQSMQISPTKKTRTSDDTSSTSAAYESQPMLISPIKNSSTSNTVTNRVANHAEFFSSTAQHNKPKKGKGIARILFGKKNPS